MEQRLNKLGFKRVSTLSTIYYRITAKEITSKESSLSQGIKLNLSNISKSYSLPVKYFQLSEDRRFIIIKLGDTYYRKLLTT